jgi:hypothetical protein
VSEAGDAPNLAKRVDLLKMDYDHTAKVLESLNSNTMTARGFAITVSAALLAVAINRNSWPTATIAALVTALFAVIDGYTAATFKRAFDHLNHVDKILRTYYESLGTSGSRAELAALLDPSERPTDHTQFGLAGAWGVKFKLEDFTHVPLRFPLLGFYAAMLLMAVLTILYLVF